MNNRIETEKRSPFAAVMKILRGDYPEHAREINRCLAEVERKSAACDDPNCNCRMDFRNFHAVSGRAPEEDF